LVRGGIQHEPNQNDEVFVGKSRYFGGSNSGYFGIFMAPQAKNLKVFDV